MVPVSLGWLLEVRLGIGPIDNWLPPLLSSSPPQADPLHQRTAAIATDPYTHDKTELPTVRDVITGFKNNPFNLL